MGKLGDGGCDGLADNGAILYACYGQRATTAQDAKIARKLQEDFTRALEQWSRFTEFRFITNAQLGPKTAEVLMQLREEHSPSAARPVRINFWRTDDFWDRILENASPRLINEIWPGVPHSQDVQLEDLVEVARIGQRLSAERGFQYIVTMNSDRFHAAVGEGFDPQDSVLDPILTDRDEDGGLFGHRFD